MKGSPKKKKMKGKKRRRKRRGVRRKRSKKKGKSPKKKKDVERLWRAVFFIAERWQFFFDKFYRCVFLQRKTVELLVHGTAMVGEKGVAGIPPVVSSVIG
jgi:hypothetical protein